jgi:hypothetical protein
MTVIVRRIQHSEFDASATELVYFLKVLIRQN